MSERKSGSYVAVGINKKRSLKAHVGRLLSCGEVSENPSWFITCLYRSPELWRRRGLAMKLDQHVALLSRASVKTQPAMKSADRRGAMRSSGMKQLVLKDFVCRD